MRYLPHTPDEIREMLARIGVPSIDALFDSIPAGARLERPLNLEPALDEISLMAHLEELAARNEGARVLSFLGAGMYDHHVPPAVDQLLLRGEFYTAYTPYQPEVSQGTLQAIFEFQTVVCEIFGMDVANASMYDGASATAEAVLMARRLTGRPDAVLCGALHPDYVETTRTYVQGLPDGCALREVPFAHDGRTDLDALARVLDERVACVVVGYPNFFGCVEDLGAVRELASRRGALLISVTTEPYALSVLEPPGRLGADVAVGEGQALACPPQFGGPGVGLFAARAEHVRQMPGRLVGQTVDAEGRRGFVLTLSTREQHIRRERATSNICTNHGLVALAFVIRAALLGRQGFEHVGRLCLARTEYLKRRLVETGRFALPFSAPTFNEVVVRRLEGAAAPLLAALAARGIVAGIALERWYPDRPHDFLLAVTEKTSRADIDRLVDALATA
ncbi:MAG: aminomethyl-transferring glycine dehydrogenase subunit GcvPA [Myxococcota bacterium]|nr:aminomethyl-transferring glycine dehydrogenase subunit GcvPA [Myxococcota bacterium]MDW8364030.1 aminomethyl-transferring glycine dehydrogenase subunit GcvPA [Myxococcales bacterium]